MVAWLEGAIALNLARQFTLPPRGMRNGDSRICHLCGRLHSRRQPEGGVGSISALIPETGNSRLVFVNGVYARTVSGCRFARWCCGEQSGWAAITHRSRVRDYLAQAQGAQGTAYSWADGCGGGLGAQNLVVETPIHLLFICSW